MRNDRNVLHEKQHEIHSLVGKTPCSYGQNRKEQVVLIRCRTSHSRLTNSYLNGNKGNNKITELRTILQRESQNS